MSFTDSSLEKLIELVANNPVLYDQSRADYRDVEYKEKIWNNIAKELNKNCDGCKKKWKFIRDGYNRYKKKTKMRTGSAASKNAKHERHQKLFFLDSVPQHKTEELSIPTSPQETVMENTDTDLGHDEEQLASQPYIVKVERIMDTEMDKSEDEQLEIPDAGENIPTEPITQKFMSKNKNRNSIDLNEFLSKSKERGGRKHNLFKKIKKRKTDDVDLFCRHIAEVLKSLPLVYKAEAKKELSIVLSNYEIMAAKDNSNAGVSSIPSSSQHTTFVNVPYTSPSENSDDSSGSSDSE